MPQPSRQALAEKKKALIQRVLAAHTNKKGKNVSENPNEKVLAVETAAPSVLTADAWDIAKERYGEAQVPIFREGEVGESGASPGLIQLVNAYLEVARTKERRILMLWPTAPQTLLPIHTLATLERWQSGDKKGIRGLTFPAKSNVFHPLNHLHFDREKILSLARELIEHSNQSNISVTRGMQDKDAYLMALASLKPGHEEQFNPTIGELLPRFYAGVEFRKWESCSGNLLENIAARLKRRVHKKALSANCDAIGDPKTAPDAMFAIDGRLSRDKLRAALVALEKNGRPDVVLVNATRHIRKGERSWLTEIARFCLLVEEVFTEDDRPGVLVITDEPHAAYRLREKLVELNSKRDREYKWKNSREYWISAVCNGVRGDGLLPPGVGTVATPVPREFKVETVDTEANRVINRLFRIASKIPGGKEVAQPVLDAAAYLSRLAALPCGVSTLVDWLSTTSTSDHARRVYSWATFHSALTAFEKSGDCGAVQRDIQECLKLGSTLYENYQNATPFALRLTSLVGHLAETKKQRIVIVYTSSIYRRLSEKFLTQYGEYPGAVQFAKFSDRVQFILSVQLEDFLPNIGDAKLIFAGLDDDGLRLLMMDNRIEKDTVILLTQRAGQYLKAVMRPLVDNFDAFKQLKPRMESILRQLQSLPDDKSILSFGDFVLPVFRTELMAESTNGSDASDPDACRIFLEGGQVIYRRPSHHVYVYDPASEHATERGFRTCEVQTLQVGDKLFFMSAELRELVESVLKEAGVPIEHDKNFESALRDYHQFISKRLQERFPGKTLTDQVRQLRESILEANPKLAKELPAALSVKHWVNLGESADTPFENLQPQAPMKKTHFVAFSQALGLSSLEAAYYWQRVIMPVRNARRLDGRHVSDLYAYMLLQPESAMLNGNIKSATIKLLFTKARDNVATVESIVFPSEAENNE
ncbi:hypothetical protein CAter282_1688 [Collimonas arenae]|uniref:Uncharacterized protein n=1 Tax=Collimonas arenae TaxID=279058 RepID=A0A127QHC7_9BURK|nr:hypothetical protein [Collimonas arenae]AMO99570.1 hypothetical protein CAter10_1820 [Collimonas arenae]AMP09469.1 hypothetical protein CAter282_1688 [Collimonas arenae]